MSSIKYQRRHQRPSLNVAIESISEFADQIHPMCLSLPGIGIMDFDNMVDSIKKHGLVDSIKVTSDRQLIDGRCRIRACLVAGVLITANMIQVCDEPPETIAQTNVARRHLTGDQKIMEAAKRLQFVKAVSAKNRRKSLNQGKRTAKTPVVEKSSTTVVSKPRTMRNSERIAKEEGVSLTKMNAAGQLIEHHPQLAEHVGSGDVSLDEAMADAGLSKKLQKKTRTKPPTVSKTSLLSKMKNLRFATYDFDVYGVTSKYASIFYGSETKREAIVYRVDKSWVLSQTIDGQSGQIMQFVSRDEAEVAAQISVET